MTQLPYPRKQPQRAGAHEPPVGWVRFILMLLLAAAGLALCCLLLTRFALKQPASILENPAMCGEPMDITAYGCAGVFASRYAAWLGLPLPIWGAGYFLGMIVWLLAAGRRLAFNWMFLLACLAALLASAAMMYVLSVVLPGTCRWCQVVHLVNFVFITFGVSCWMSSQKTQVKAPGAIRTTILAALLSLSIVALFGLGIAALMFAGRSNQYSRSYLALRLDPEYQQWLFARTPRKRIPLMRSDHVLGPRKARLKIFVFKDFQCPSCHEAWQLLKDIQGKYPQHIALIPKNYPLDKRCNPRVKTSMHPFSCAAAKAAEAAAVAGGEEKFWKYHQLLQNYRRKLELAPYLKLAVEAGFNSLQFQQALLDEKVERAIQRDIELAAKLGVHATPAIFINGKYVDGWKAKGLLEKLIRRELIRLGAKLPKEQRPGATRPAKLP